MNTRTYGQYCGLARALELVGDRWALLVVRNLMVGPRRFSELEEGLDGVSSSVLAARLKALEGAGVVQREVAPRPDSGFRYALTDFGRDLEGAVGALSRWGARALGPRQPDQAVTCDGVVVGLRTIFRPECAEGMHCSYEVMIGDAVVRVRVHDGIVEAEPGPLPDADLSIVATPRLRAVLAGEISVEDALDQGLVTLHGDETLFRKFVEAFRIGPPPGAATVPAATEPTESA